MHGAKDILNLSKKKNHQEKNYLWRRDVGIENDIKMNTGEVGSEIVNWRHLRGLEILTVAKDQAFWYLKRCTSIGEKRRFEPNLCAEE
jgi:hypothetical protein